MSRDRTYKPVINPKKYHVSQDEIDQIRDEARHAKELLQNPYLKTYLHNAKQSILDIHAKQLLQDSSEEKEQNGGKTILHFSAKKEYTLLAGQYRFIDDFLSDLEQTIQIAKDMEEKIQSEEIEVEVPPGE